MRSCCTWAAEVSRSKNVRNGLADYFPAASNSTLKQSDRGVELAVLDGGFLNFCRGCTKSGVEL